ncbi:hypothetical protein [Nitritalea halalkaliphila]|uniref:hypothetical protein n=1 Tax=Nitritalea halalkaliphila TaxID=590849 RepID=UPI001EE68721|nr:hypothetical protein [Nitritalea halalkaliphila]
MQTSPATGLPFTRFYSSKVYKGGIQNYAFTQDSYGSLFVANNFGLLHYDGTDWQRFGLPNSTKIRDLWVEHDEKVYVAAQGEIGYFHFQTGPEPVYHSLLDRLPEGYRDLEEVWKVFRLHEHLVFCTFDYLFIFDEHETLIRIIESDSGFLSFHQHQQQLYVQDSDKGLLRLERDRLQTVPQGESLTKNLIRGMVTISPMCCFSSKKTAACYS